MRPLLPIALALLVLYGPTYWDMSHGIWRGDEQAHAPIIAVIVAWLIWRGRAALDEPGRPAALASGLMLAVGLAAYACGRALELPLLEIGSQIPVLAGVLLFLGGKKWLRAFAFPLGFLLFMLPLPGVLVDALTSPIKEWISMCAEELLYRAGYPIARSGVILSLSQYRLLVADACSGLSSMIFLGALGLLFLHLAARHSRIHVALLLASILPIAFAANLARVLFLLLLTYHAGDALGQGPLHDVTGVATFILALTLLFVLDALLSKALPSVSVPPPPAGRNRLPRQINASRATWLSIPLLAAAGAAMALQPAQNAAGLKPRLELEAAIPTEFAGWRQASGLIPIAPKMDAATPYSQTLARTYVDADNRRVMLVIAYGDRQLGDAMQAHRPEYCYKAQGFAISAAVDQQLETWRGTLPIRRLHAQRQGRSEPVSYWMTVGDQAALPGLERKIAQARQALSGTVPDGLLVRVSSIDDLPQGAYALHDRFVIDLLSALPEAGRVRLAGAARYRPAQ